MLLDTSGLLCLLDQKEKSHQAAREAFQLATEWLTHNYVLAEFIPLATVRGLGRSEVLRFAGRLLANVDVELVWVDEVLHGRAMALLHLRLDKTYSLCDAVSFILMREHDIGEALTTDRHFEQEQFVRLLK
jgi:uncharacterized protein